MSRERPEARGAALLRRGYLQRLVQAYRRCETAKVGGSFCQRRGEALPGASEAALPTPEGQTDPWRRAAAVYAEQI